MNRGGRGRGVNARGGLAAFGLLSCLFSLQPSPAGATPIQIGDAELVVRSVRGEVEDMRRHIAVRDDVFSREVVETGPASATRLAFRDGTELSVGADSRVALDRFVYDPDRGTGSLWLELAAGVFRWISGSMPASSYSVRMPFGTLAVRGTVVGVDVEGGVVLVERGAAEVRLGDGRAFVVREGQCLLVSGAAGPRLVDRRECERWLGRYEAMLAALRDAALAQALEQLCPGPVSLATYASIAEPPAASPAPPRDGAAAGDGRGDGPVPDPDGRRGGPDTDRQPWPATDGDGGDLVSGPGSADRLANCFPVVPVFAAWGGGGPFLGLPPGPPGTAAGPPTPHGERRKHKHRRHGGGPGGRSPTPVEEPPTWWLLASGAFLLALACARRRQRPDRP